MNIFMKLYWINVNMYRLRVLYSNQSALVRSLFTSKAISRKYDCWYYRRGKRISMHKLFMEKFD